MNYAHYHHVIERFGLTDYQTCWHNEYAKITSNDLMIGVNTRSRLAYIYCESLGYDLASQLESVHTAEEIIQYIKETELLFV